MFCSKCGKKNDNTAKFCGGCGVAIAASQSARSNQARQGASYEKDRKDVNQVPAKKKGASKYTELLAIAGLALVVAAVAFFMIARGSTLPNGTYTRDDNNPYLGILGYEFTVNGSKLFVNTRLSYGNGFSVSQTNTYRYKIRESEMTLTLESSEATEIYSDYAMEQHLSWVADNLGKKVSLSFEKRSGKNSYFFDNVRYEKQ